MNTYFVVIDNKTHKIISDLYNSLNELKEDIRTGKLELKLSGKVPENGIVHEHDICEIQLTRIEAIVFETIFKDLNKSEKNDINVKPEDDLHLIKDEIIPIDNMG